MSELRAWMFGLCAWLLCALSACQNPFVPAEDPWPGEEVNAPSENVMWAVAGMALEKSGFPVGSGADPATLVMTSGWKMSLAPFKGDGYRERAELRIKSIATGRWRVEVRVEKETNEDMKRPMDPANAQWKPAPDDADAAGLILRRIRALLGDELPPVEDKRRSKV